MYLRFNEFAFDTENIVTLGQHENGQIRLFTTKHNSMSKHQFDDSRTIEQIYDELFSHTVLFLHKGIIYNPHTIGGMKLAQNSGLSISLDVSSYNVPDDRLSYSGYEGYGHPHDPSDFDYVLEKLNGYRSFIRVDNETLDLERIIVAQKPSEQSIIMMETANNTYNESTRDIDMTLEDLQKTMSKFEPCFIYKGILYNASNISKLKHDPSDNSIGVYGHSDPENLIQWCGFKGFGDELAPEDFDVLISLMNKTKYGYKSLQTQRGQKNAVNF